MIALLVILLMNISSHPKDIFTKGFKYIILNKTIKMSSSNIECINDQFENINDDE
jgi:hypothetical protein